MRNLFLALICFVFLAFAGTAANAWEVEFNFTLDDIKDRNVGKVMAGGLMSIAAHEAGHFVVGRALGFDTKFTWKSGPAVWSDNFYDKSESDRAIFAVAGMLSQSIVGTILTAAANDSDYTLGFNALSAVSNLTYPVRDKGGSDWKHMPGGKLICIGNGLYQSALVGFNINVINITSATQ